MIRIGSRGSALALVQARLVQALLIKAWQLDSAEVAIIVIKTSGDRILDRPLSEVGGKGLFTKEIEAALLAGEIDLAVHSMKDVETKLAHDLVISAMLPREDVREAFISRSSKSLDALPRGAKLGTSSLRRQAQVLRLRPDLNVVGLRGNVDTRLGKVASGELDATLLAGAGLARLGLKDQAQSLVETNVMLPAVAQGAIGIETRGDDARIRDLLKPLNDEPTALCVTAERAMLGHLDGSCRTPIAGLAKLGPDGSLSLQGELLSNDGMLHAGGRAHGPAARALELASDVADQILRQSTAWPKA